MLRFVLSIVAAAAFVVVFCTPMPAFAQQKQESEAPKPPSLESLSWIAGSWTSNEGGVTTEEVWLEPRGGMMLGMNRAARGKMATFESLRIVESRGKISYLASPGGTKPTPFALKELDDMKVVFENLGNDFPQRIIYQRTGDQLVAKIEGVMAGKLQAMEMTWNKTGTSANGVGGKLRRLRSAVYRVNDLAKAKAWYTKVLGIAPYFDEPYYVGFKIGNQELGLDPDVESLVRGNNQAVYWDVSSCQGSYDELLKLGAKADKAPADVGEGTMVATVADPFGNIFGIIEVPPKK